MRTVLATDESISCEVCELLHRPEVERCEQCGHRLGTAPDWAAMELELAELKRRAVLGVVAVVVMIALNLTIFGGAGYILLLAPLGWVVFGVPRYRTISALLRKHGRR